MRFFFTLLVVAAALAGCVTAVPAKGPVAGAGVARRPAAGTARPGATASAIRGVVLGLDGMPLAGVAVGAVLVSDAGGSLLSKPRFPVVSNGGGTLVANNGAGVVGTSTAGYALRQADAPPLEARTDAGGRFELVVPPGAVANVEAVRAEPAGPLKALSLGVAVGADVTLRLAPTGTLTGRVTAPGVADLRGVDVYIPGTRYLARTDSEGRWAMAEVPVGRFELVAESTALGEAILRGVQVTARRETDVGEVALVLGRPLVERVDPPAAGPGGTVVITGRQFGAPRGRPFQVRVGGVTVTDPIREGDTIRLKVPAAASDEGIVVEVDGVVGPAAPFTVIRTLRLPGARLDLVAGARAPVPVEVFDGSGQAIASPTLGWTVQPVGLAAVEDGVLVAGAAAGEGFVRVASGELVATRPVRIVADQDEVVGDALLDDVQALTVLDGVVYVARWTGILAQQGGGPVRVVHGRADPEDDSGDLSDTNALAADGAGGLFFNDRTAVMRRTSDGTILPFAGSPSQAGRLDGVGTAARFTDIAAMARHADGTLYVLERQQATGSFRSWIRTVGPDGVVKTLPDVYEGDLLEEPRMVVRADRSVIVWNPGTTYHEAAPGSSALQAREARGVDNLDALAVGPDGRVVVASGTGLHVLSPDGTTTRLGGVLPRFSALTALTFDAAGHLWGADTALRRVIDLGRLP
jgi:hypothetical protein